MPELETANWMEEKKENFKLHQDLIKKHVQPISENLSRESVKHFYETGKVSGALLYALIGYAENYHELKK